MIRHYYHLYADGQWQEPVAEHLAALATIDVPLDVTVGLVGSPDNRAAARDALAGLAVSRWVQADGGWEQVTLAALRADLAYVHSGPVLYAHTKGAHDPSPINVAWRHSMTRRVVAGWRECLDRLAEVDVVGCHWLTRAAYPRLVDNPFFGGNFWWAHPDYLRHLPALDYDTRWDAEKWVGQGRPRVHDLLPGWPGFHLFGQAVA